MKRQSAHITIRGIPLCQVEGHDSGLMHRLDVCCGHRSLSRARIAWREIAKHRWWKTVKVVRGSCPVAGPYQFDAAAIRLKLQRDFLLNKEENA